MKSLFNLFLLFAFVFSFVLSNAKSFDSPEKVENKTEKVFTANDEPILSNEFIFVEPYFLQSRNIIQNSIEPNFYVLSKEYKAKLNLENRFRYIQKK